ncbi:MAG: carbohydrate-binding protein [Fusicatenibacter sp.]|nr:carbohydrate-binding protein [Lachnospiraceae bacterium]MDY2937770.1 carbohydrate-binding protein [Fusicatenibacter sp.]
MGQISIKLVDKEGKTLSIGRGENEVNLVYCAPYQEGDRIFVDIGDQKGFYWLMLDDARGRSLVYLTGNISYTIPFGEKRINLSPNTFSGKRHLLWARKAYAFETEGYRNLSENLWDQHGDVNCYPHASANVETRGESVFAAMNAVDGVTVTCCHGEWPYQSWGINRREDALLRIDFGRTVVADRIILYTRADFPHDSWWDQATVMFSDGSSIVLPLKKSGNAQEFTFEEKEIEYLELGQLIKSEDPSPFPALVQIQVYGREK